MVIRFAPYASAWGGTPRFYIDEVEKAIGVPLQGFADKTEAEAVRKELERAAREVTPIGPFLQSKLPDGASEIAAAAKSANLPLPDYTKLGPEAKPIRNENSVTYTRESRAYRKRVEEAVTAWWELVSGEITPEANTILWDKLFPEFRFYAISRVLVAE
jgi:hypothetical protein